MINPYPMRFCKCGDSISQYSKKSQTLLARSVYLRKPVCNKQSCFRAQKAATIAAKNKGDYFYTLKPIDLFTLGLQDKMRAAA